MEGQDRADYRTVLQANPDGFVRSPYRLIDAPYIVVLYGPTAVYCVQAPGSVLLTGASILNDHFELNLLRQNEPTS